MGMTPTTTTGELSTSTTTTTGEAGVCPTNGLPVLEGAGLVGNGYVAFSSNIDNVNSNGTKLVYFSQIDPEGSNTYITFQSVCLLGSDTPRFDELNITNLVLNFGGTPSSPPNFTYDYNIPNDLSLEGEYDITIRYFTENPSTYFDGPCKILVGSV